MPGLKDIAGGPEIYRILVGFPWLDERGRFTMGKVTIASADDTIGQILGVAIGMHINQACHKIGIRCTRSSPQVYRYGTGYFNILLQYGSCIDKNICAALGLTLIIWSWTILRRHEQSSAAGHHRIGRIIVISIGRFGVGPLGTQQAIAVQ